MSAMRASWSWRLTARFVKHLPPRLDPATGLLSPWWRPLHELGVVYWRWWPGQPWYMRGPGTFHPERGAGWLVPLPPDTVIFDVDIVAFRRFNDTWGIPIGDAVLREVGRRIQLSVAPWPAFRPGGDEFLIFARLGDDQSIEAMCDEVSGAQSAAPWSSISTARR